MHDSTFVAEPLQAVLISVRVLDRTFVLVPPPHVLEHPPADPHEPHWQYTLGGGSSINIQLITIANIFWAKITECEIFTLQLLYYMIITITFTDSKNNEKRTC